MNKKHAHNPIASPEPDRNGTVAERITDLFETLGRREQDVAREILRQYPLSALSTVAALAERSSVSTATVLRLVQRLDLNGYGEFQEAVKSDVACLLETPLQRLSAQTAHPAPEEGSLLSELLARTAHQLQKCHDPVMDADFRTAIALLADPKNRIYCAGGHRSRHIAALLTEYLGLLRPNVQLVEGPSEGWQRYLLEMNNRTVVCVTDIRRYQPSLLKFSSLASAQGAHVIAISDAWADRRDFGAEVLFRMPSASASPIDSHCGQLLMAEALVGGLANKIGSPLHERLALGETMSCTSSTKSQSDNP
ncbi:MurR/RpiR family transcriptional regulator [Sulfitobacter sp. NFXS29]|uniref:MurR/RpiR family transcriptional regulator n=1 Tax=Sulfitobacter sp. NFXS29 TaxID=2818438 RepID=UPI0032DE3686